MDTFLIKQRLKKLRYRLHMGLEKILYRLLFIKRINYDDFLEKTAYGFVVHDDELTKALAERYTFHTTPRRKHYLDATLRFVLYRWYMPIFNVKTMIKNKIYMFLFYRTKEFTWNTHHYLRKSGTDHIDGYIEFKKWGVKCYITLDMCSVDGLKNESREFDFKSGKYKRSYKVLDLNRYGKWGYSTIFVPKKLILPRDIPKILKLWYSEKMKFKYRHWTCSGEKPTINIGELCFEENLCIECYQDKVKGTCVCP